MKDLESLSKDDGKKNLTNILTMAAWIGGAYLVINGVQFLNEYYANPNSENIFNLVKNYITNMRIVDKTLPFVYGAVYGGLYIGEKDIK